jgi:2,4-dienoyl-CoA reductase (NADPH2)
MDAETPYPHLFSPGTIGGVTIRNRIVQSAMGTGLMELGRVGDREVAFQEERARGGVGLIVNGGTSVHETSGFPVRILTELWDESAVESLRRRAEAVQRHGARIFGQLIHLGRETPGGVTDFAPLAPSPVPSPRSADTPHELTRAEIATLVDAYARSAANLQAAGYDGTEIHGAHGYLVAQFLSPASNRRDDAYRGDTLEGRMRLLRELVEAIRTRCGDGFALGVRLSADEHAPGGLRLDDTLEIVDALQEASPVDYVSITTGMRGGYVKDSSWDEGFALGLAEAVKQIVDVPVIAAGRIRRPDLAERALAAGQVDFVAIGRAMLVDPEWPEKARTGRADQIRPCIGIVQDCRRAEGIVACAVNARTGRETEFPPVARTAEPRRVVVVGAGPAGLEAARVAAEAGHDVVVFEREAVPGGQVRIAAAGPTREEQLDFVFYLEREVTRLGVDLRYGHAARKRDVLAEEPDLVVVAAGATPIAPEFTVDGGARVVTVWDLLGGGVKDIPARAVVLDDAIGFWHGVSSAEFLAEQGASVELLTPARGVALAIPHESVGGALHRLRANGVRFRPLATIASVSGTTVSLSDPVTGGPLGEVEADLVVVRTRLRMNDELVGQLEDEVPALVAIGDCSAPRRLSHAVLDANVALRKFEAGKLSPVPLVPF